MLSATAALCSLACDRALRKDIVSAGGIEPLVELVRSGTPAQQSKAAEALKMLAYENHHNKDEIARARGIEPLVAILSSFAAVGAGTDDIVETAAGALCNLACAGGDMRRQIARAGAVEPLVSLLASRRSPRDQGSAAAAINNLAADDDVQAELVKAGAIEPLVCLARDGSKLQKEHAESALTNLALKSDSNLVAISKAGHRGGLAADLFLMRDRTGERVARARQQAARQRAKLQAVGSLYERAASSSAEPTAQHAWLVAAEVDAAVDAAEPVDASTDTDVEATAAREQAARERAKLHAVGSLWARAATSPTHTEPTAQDEWLAAAEVDAVCAEEVSATL